MWPCHPQDWHEALLRLDTYLVNPSSADVARHGRITKRGDMLMRGILTECALTHIQHAPNSYVTKAYVRIGRKRGNGKAIVAAAARMLHVAYLILKERRECHE